MGNLNSAKLFKLSAISAVVLTLSACGSSNSDGESVVPPVNNVVFPSVVIGEVQATTASTITVNQLEIPASNVEVEIDGVNASLNQVKVGMMVEVETNGVSATEIEYDPDFKGPIYIQNDSVSIAGVALNNFDSSELASGDLVEISGYTSAYNTLTVTYQQPIANNQGELEVEGIISQLNTQQRTFSLGNIAVNYQQAEVDGLLSEGQYVDVEGFMSGQQLMATEVDAEQDNRFNDNTDTQLTGQITWLNSDATLMTINGQWQVSVTAQTQFEDGTVSDLAIGRFVEIDALWQQADNLFIAQEVDFESSENNGSFVPNTTFSVTGLASYAQGVVAINGITFTINNQTIFDDGLNTNNLNGQWLELEGIIVDDKNVVNEIELADANELLELKGYVIADENQQPTLWGYISEDGSLAQYLDQYVDLECNFVSANQVRACQIDD
ncbi:MULTISPECIES: DUF5666 domain-containing protein [Pseudoalteromonas]|uniref:DUF5666 domain-containing protein n=1 Tax=Pseudoalteromonas TaxID=53246 RepID=UPI0002E084FD|nr:MULTISPECIES: DUF5666 domain-containing protein [Pseudoalteromonas]MCF6146215.1 hypothetical protein [Pseudoalteromonas mariniglutinosa NCIMB 1770]